MNKVDIYRYKTIPEIFQYMKAFTAAYRQSDDKYQREVNCLRVQLEHAMLPLRADDLLAGRCYELAIGFLPQSEDGVGYYYYDHAMCTLRESEELSPAERHQVAELEAFWEKENTNRKIYDTYDREILTQLPHFKPVDAPEVGFLLYRLTGAQMDPRKLFRLGISGLMEQATASMEKNPPFYRGIIGILELFKEVCHRYEMQAVSLAEEADEIAKPYLMQMAENLRIIADDKPHTFWQALQMAYLYMTISGTYDYGRMDEYLGDFLVDDLKAERLTEDFAKELLKSLWKLLLERNKIYNSRIILGGKDRANIENADRFALLAIDVAKTVKEIVPQLTLRCYTGMNEAVSEKALEAIGAGATYPILYNDDINVPSVAKALRDDEATAQKYVPYGCGEYVIYNQSLATPSGTINLLQGLNKIIYSGSENLLVTSKDFESFYQAYLTKMRQIIRLLARQEKIEYDICGREAPFLFYSALMDDCMERGKPILEGGLRYLSGTLECYGNVNTSDSLTAIKWMVYDKKCVSAEELSAALACDFEGYEDLRQSLIAVPKYGNDNDIADQMAVRLHEDICRIISDCAKEIGLHTYLPVIINNSMNTTFGNGTGASADGRRAHTFMANANNPTGGMDQNGITAMLNSLVKLKVDCHAGSVQNMRFSKEMFTTLLPKTKGILKTYFDCGGSQAMISVLGRGDLEAAMEHPEQYKNLIVRVGGFSARFVELPNDVQKELLSRTLY